jgi:hypothetical protein
MAKKVILFLVCVLNFFLKSGIFVKSSDQGYIKKINEHIMNKYMMAVNPKIDELEIITPPQL